MLERLTELLTSLETERSYELETYRSLTEEKPVKERIAEGLTVYPLDYKDHRYSKYDELILDFNYPLDQHGRLFGTNGKCTLYSNNSQETVHATLLKLKEGNLSLILGEDELPDWIKDGKIGVNALCDTRTYDVQIEALKGLLETTSSLTYAFYHKNPEQFNSPDFEKSEDLNESQNEAVSAVLSGAQFQIIHGPPGTGKTKTLVAAISKLAELGKNILVAAPTNAAADHISHELTKKGVPLLRYGHSLKIQDRVMHLTLHDRLKNHPENAILDRLTKEAEEVRKKANRYVRNFDSEAREARKRLREELREIRKDIRRLENSIRESIVGGSRVITGTLIGLQQPEITGRTFDLVIVDEAGQALEPAIWSLARYSKQLVLAGDPFQLPPSLFSPATRNSALSKSLIEMALELGYPTLLLNIQYRMNQLILEYSNQYFYASQVKSSPENMAQQLAGDPFLPVEFIDTAGCGFEEQLDDKGGISNPGEADILMKRLLEVSQEDKSLGIISPYRKQVSLLKELAEGLDCTVETVDSFQGQERDIILISLVRSNSSSEIGFLKDYRRMNVAMTRARYKLIILGDSSTIATDSFYLGLLNFMEEKCSYRSAYEYFS